MKNFSEIETKFTPEEIAESLVFPGHSDKSGREAALSTFREFRKKASSLQSEESRIISQLLQLRFMIENYLKSDVLNKDYYFGYFLKEYIVRLGRKNYELAEEIDVNTTELSQIINRHRKPTEKLVFRLEIHSNRNFPAMMWFKLMEKERAYELKHDKKLIEKEEKHVKRKLEFSF